MFDALDQAVRGVSAGFDRLDEAASRIARDGVDGDLAGNLVESIRARQEVRANVAVIRVADETIGSLLDVLA